MDLLFKRYASPFSLIDEMIHLERFSEFVSEFMDIYIEERDNKEWWELYLHHPYLRKSFSDFKKEMTKANPEIQRKNYEPFDESKLEATIKNSREILNSFNPSW